MTQWYTVFNMGLFFLLFGGPMYHLVNLTFPNSFQFWHEHVDGMKLLAARLPNWILCSTWPELVVSLLPIRKLFVTLFVLRCCIFCPQILDTAPPGYSDVPYLRSSKRIPSLATKTCWDFQCMANESPINPMVRYGKPLINQLLAALGAPSCVPGS